MNFSRKIIFTAFGGVLAIFLLLFLILLRPVEGAADRVIVIDAGEGVEEIANHLLDAGLIRSRQAFTLYSFFSGTAHRLKPGTYMFSHTWGVPTIIRRLEQGPPELEVLVREGTSLKDVEAALVAMNLLHAGDLVHFPMKEVVSDYPFLSEAKSLEGFLFPDTYRMLPGSAPVSIVRKFLDTFEKKALPLFSSLSGERRKNWYQQLILASLIEREVQSDSDRRIVSGILKRRIALGMSLQVDATIFYAKCSGSFAACPPLTRGDFKVSSVFNTYRNQGLPPFPISNPGESAIQAAFSPQSSDFLYYLSDPTTGETIFSKTLDEHNANRARYLKL